MAFFLTCFCLFSPVDRSNQAISPQTECFRYAASADDRGHPVDRQDGTIRAAARFTVVLNQDFCLSKCRKPMRFRHGLRYCTPAQRQGYSALRRYGVLHGNLKKNFVGNNHRISCNTAGTTTSCRGLLLTSAQTQITPLKKKCQQFRHFGPRIETKAGK